MVEKVIVSIVSFLLFTYMFIFKLIKKNDTTYVTILVIQAIRDTIKLYTNNI